MDEKIKELLKGTVWGNYFYCGKIGNKDIYCPYVTNEIGYYRRAILGKPHYIICENGEFSLFHDKNFKIFDELLKDDDENENDLVFEVKNYIYKKLHSKIKEEEIFRKHDKLFEKYFKDDKLIFNNDEEK